MIFGGVDETPLVSMEKIRLLEIPTNLMKQPYDVEEKIQAPTVITPLQPINAQEGSPVVLTAKIDGSPMPNVSRVIFLWSLYTNDDNNKRERFIVLRIHKKTFALYSGYLCAETIASRVVIQVCSY